MKNIKIEKEYIDNGFGFPVLLLNVPFIEVRGVWVPNINYVRLSNTVLKMLVLKKTRLTGNELKFIRLKFEMTLEAFAKRFYVSHPAVLKWENKREHATNMNWSTEKDIRLFIYNKITDIDDFKNIYLQLEQEPNITKKETEIIIEDKELIYA